MRIRLAFAFRIPTRRSLMRILFWRAVVVRMAITASYYVAEKFQVVWRVEGIEQEQSHAS